MFTLCENALTMASACQIVCCCRQGECTELRDRSDFLKEKTNETAFMCDETCLLNRGHCVCDVTLRAHISENFWGEFGYNISKILLVCKAHLNLPNSSYIADDSNSVKYQLDERSCEHLSQNSFAHLVLFHPSCGTESSRPKQVRIADAFCSTAPLKTWIFLHIVPPFYNGAMKIERLKRFASAQRARGLESEARPPVCGSRTLCCDELSSCDSHNQSKSCSSFPVKFWHCVRICFKMDNASGSLMFQLFYFSSTTNAVNYFSSIFVIPVNRSIASQANSFHLNSRFSYACDPAVPSALPRCSFSSSDTGIPDQPACDGLFCTSVSGHEASTPASSSSVRGTISSFVAANEVSEKPISSPNSYQSCDLDHQLADGKQLAVPGALGVPSRLAFSPNETNNRDSKRSVRPWFSLRAARMTVLHRLIGMMFLLWPIIAAASAIKEPPRLTVPYPFEMVTVPRSDDRSLLCPIVGTPTPIFEWYKDSESVPDDAGWDRITVSDSRLRIKDAQMEDSGRYVCTAVNGFGKLNYTFAVTVNDPLAPPSLHEDQGAPTLLQVYPQSPEPPVIKVAGQSVTLKCRVGGVPEPVVVWYKDGIPVSDNGSPALVRSNDLHTLHIGRLHRADAGLYTCTATNLYGPVTANWTLQVLAGGGGGVSSSPAHTHPPLRVHNATVVEGEQEGVLTCEGASGSGEPHVKWLRARGSSNIGSSVGDPFIEWRGREFAVLPPSSVVMQMPGVFVTKLVIERPEQEHAGEYVCMATTTDGTAVGTANLSVMPRGPGRILLVVMGLLGSIAVIAVVTAVVATYRRRRRQQRHVGAFKPAPAAGGYKGHPPSQASSNLLQADDCQRQPGKNGMAGSVNGGPHAPRYVRPPGVQGRVGDSGALLPNQEGMVARYQDQSSVLVYLSGQQVHNDSSGGSDYKPPLTPLNDFQQQQQQQQYQQIAAPQQYHLPSQQQQQHQYQLPQQHLLTSPQCGLQQHPSPPQQQQQYPTSMQQQIPPQQFQYHQLDVI